MFNDYFFLDCCGAKLFAGGFVCLGCGATIGEGGFGAGAEDRLAGRLYWAPAGDIGEPFSKGIKPNPAAPAGSVKTLRKMMKNLCTATYWHIPR